MNKQWETLLVNVDGSLASVVMNRPDRKNAANTAMISDLHECLSMIAKRDDVHVVVLTGSGHFFCPGGDTEAIAAGDIGFEQVDGRPSPIYDVALVLHEMPQLTIAMINGACAGAGLGFACACDVRVAVTSANFSTAFLRHGLPGSMCLPWSLPRTVGAGSARFLSFVPERFTASDALRLGLVSAVYRPEEYESRVDALRRRLRDAEPSAVRSLKASYRAAERGRPHPARRPSAGAVRQRAA